MYLRLFRAVWFISLLAFLACLLYVYAGLQERARLPYPSQTSAYIAFSREAFFYLFLALGTVFNVLVFVARNVMPQKKYNPFKTWLYGFIITLNVFFIVAISFTGVYNTGEIFDYSRIGIIIYGSVILVGGSVLSWPVYLIFSRFGNKQTV